MEGLSQSEMQQFFHQLCRIRRFEENVGRLAAAGAVPGFVHLSTGQEAVAVGVCAALTAKDYVYSGHRAHGHVLARGCDAYAVMAEILGRADGVCGGRGGSMHLAVAAQNVLGATGVVGGNIPLALGAAWAARERGEDRIAAVFFGDGATGGGLFHESLNLASLWQLPVLFVCENNGYAEFTSRAEHSRVDRVSGFATPYGIAAEAIDGNDVMAVHRSARQSVAAVRAGGGPFLLECMTYRMAGHYAGDGQQYRTREEMAAWQPRDPILRLQGQLCELGVSEGDLRGLMERARSEIDAITEQARQAPRADGAGVLEHVYAHVYPTGQEV